MPADRERPTTDECPVDDEHRMPTLREPRYSQSLERGLAILGCFTGLRPVLGISEIADELGMSRSTTHRYTITLLALGYLEQCESRKYRLAMPITRLGMSALSSTSLQEHSRLLLEQLCQRSSYTVNLAILDGPDIVYVERARSPRRGQTRIDLGLAPGSRLPAYCTSMGKLLLAHLPQREQRELLDETTLTTRGPNTITRMRELKRELDHIRTHNFAVNDQELAPGLYSISAPVRSESHEVVAAINMAAHTSMISLDRLVDQLGPHLISVADQISARLGYRRNDESPSRRRTASSHEFPVRESAIA